VHPQARGSRRKRPPPPPPVFHRTPLQAAAAARRVWRIAARQRRVAAAAGGSVQPLPPLPPSPACFFEAAAVAAAAAAGEWDALQPTARDAGDAPLPSQQQLPTDAERSGSQSSVAPQQLPSPIDSPARVGAASSSRHPGEAGSQQPQGPAAAHSGALAGAAAAAPAADANATVAALPPGWERRRVDQPHPAGQDSISIGGVRMAIPPFYDVLAAQGRVPSLRDTAIDEDTLQVRPSKTICGL